MLLARAVPAASDSDASVLHSVLHHPSSSVDSAVVATAAVVVVLTRVMCVYAARSRSPLERSRAFFASRGRLEPAHPLALTRLHRAHLVRLDLDRSLEHKQPQPPQPADAAHPLVFGEPLALRGHRECVDTVDIAPDGSRFASGSADQL